MVVCFEIFRTDGRTDERSGGERLVGNSLAFDRLYARLPAHERNGHKGKSSGYVLNKNSSSWLKRGGLEHWFREYVFLCPKNLKNGTLGPWAWRLGLKCLLLYGEKNLCPLLILLLIFFTVNGSITKIHVLIAATRWFRCQEPFCYEKKESDNWVWNVWKMNHQELWLLQWR